MNHLSKTKNILSKPLPRNFSPQLALLVDQPPEGDDWLHEVKLDGYRILAFLEAGKVKLVTRNGNDWTLHFPAIAKALGQLKCDSAIIDGEAVMLDSEGRSDFQALQASMKQTDREAPCLFAFDLPFLNGVDLTDNTLLDRKKALKTLLEGASLAPMSFTRVMCWAGAERCFKKHARWPWKESSPSASMRGMWVEGK